MQKMQKMDNMEKMENINLMTKRTLCMIQNTLFMTQPAVFVNKMTEYIQFAQKLNLPKKANFGPSLAVYGPKILWE